MGRGETYEPSMGFSPQAARLMRRAEAVAERFGQRAVCVEHLLLELLREEYGPAAQIIDLLADRTAMCQELESVLAASRMEASADAKRVRFKQAQDAHQAMKQRVEEERRLFREWLASRGE